MLRMLRKDATPKQIQEAREVSGGGFWLKFVSYWAMINCCGADCCVTYDQRNRVMALKGINDGSGCCGNFCKSCCCSPCAQCQHARELNPQKGAARLNQIAPVAPLVLHPVVAQPVLVF